MLASTNCSGASATYSHSKSVPKSDQSISMLMMEISSSSQDMRATFSCWCKPTLVDRALPSDIIDAYLDALDLHASVYP